MLEKLFVSMLNMSLIGSYAIVFVLIARLLLKKTPKIFSYALWGIVLFRLLCPFSFESALSLMPTGNSPIPQDIIDNTAPQINTGIAAFDSMVNPILPVPSNIGESVSPIQSWLFIGTVLWALGMLAMLIYSIVAFVKLKQRLLGAAHMKENIYLADHISSPFVMGLFKPKIYLPSSLSDSEKGFIIAHEMCHVRRFDYVTRILGFAALAFHWFNPLVWVAFIVSGKDMELSCDEAVMKKMNTDIRTEYSQSLLRFGTVKSMVHATPLAFGEGNTKSRVKNALNYKKPMLWVLVISVIAVVAVAVVLISNPTSEPLPIEAKGVSVEKLWGNRTEYVGNNAAVGNVLHELSFPDNMQYKNFELKTKEQPYEIIVHFDGVTNALKSTDYGNGQTETVLNIDFAQLEQNARIMFSLIENVEKITFSINRDNGGTLTSDFARNKYEELFSKTETLEGFQTVLDEILDNRNANTLTDFEAIKIGTQNADIHKQFGEPSGMLFGRHGDIYIVDDKKIMIYYGFEGEGSYPVTEVNISDYIPEKLTHDQAVVSALTSSENRHLNGECFAEGHIILGYDDSDVNKTHIYTLVTFGSYGFENDNFLQVSGSAFPAVITLNSDNTVSIEGPMDGIDYGKSLEKMFPKEYHDRMVSQIVKTKYA